MSSETAPRSYKLNDFESEDEIDILLNEITQVYIELVNNNFEQAKQVYHMVHSKYEGMSEHNKQYVYPQLHRLYLVMK